MLLSYNCSQDRKILAREVFISLILEICTNFAGEALLILGLKDSVLRPALSGAGGQTQTSGSVCVAMPTALRIYAPRSDPGQLFGGRREAQVVFCSPVRRRRSYIFSTEVSTSMLNTFFFF